VTPNKNPDWLTPAESTAITATDETHYNSEDKVHEFFSQVLKL
jgi:hypothetical protein